MDLVVGNHQDLVVAGIFFPGTRSEAGGGGGAARPGGKGRSAARGELSHTVAAAGFYYFFVKTSKTALAGVYGMETLRECFKQGNLAKMRAVSLPVHAL